MIFFIIILGACLGSFCTSLASRIIEKKPFFISRSFCFSCDTKLKYYEIIPIFSYIFEDFKNIMFKQINLGENDEKISLGFLLEFFNSFA